MTISITVPGPGNDTITLNGANDYASYGQTDVYDEVDGLIINYTKGCVYWLDYADLEGTPPPEGQGPWRWDDFINFPDDPETPDPDAGDDLMEYVYYGDTGDGGISSPVEWPSYSSSGPAAARAARKGGPQKGAPRPLPPKVIAMRVIPEGATDVTVTLDAGYAGFVFLSRVRYDADHRVAKQEVLTRPLAASTGAAQTVRFPPFDFSQWHHVHVAVAIQKHAGRPVGQRLKPYEGNVHGNKT
jgi:hypothetical protein